jgi:2-polyprenyl-3-methyl-5-hydroxy-6-metoxy-1,4-benzoquinol methylase
MAESNTRWQEAQKHEKQYWGTCQGMTAWGEFCKGEMYGREMRLFEDYGTLNGELYMPGKTVLDVGGGPISMTLRCIGAKRLVVADPCEWPPSVHRRYANYKIEFIQAPGEALGSQHLGNALFDEVWLYNVLQHVQDPAKVVANAVACVSPHGVLRIFEWLYIPADDCHPHVLTPEGLLNWLRGCCILKVGLPHLKEFWSDATAFTGIFSPPGMPT